MRKIADHWNRRQLSVANGEVLTWLLMDDPRHGAPHVECAKVIAADGNSRLLHVTDALTKLP